MRIFLGLTVMVLAWTSVSLCSAQNVIKDYVRNSPAKYQPSDPWIRGVVFRTHAGYDGCFFNCDHEEDKRFSPYIYWKCQPKHCKPRFPIIKDLTQQICEVKQRIAWGACRDCETAGHGGQYFAENGQPSEEVQIAQQYETQNSHLAQINDLDANASLLKDPDAVARRLGYQVANPVAKNGVALQAQPDQYQQVRSAVPQTKKSNHLLIDAFKKRQPPEVSRRAAERNQKIR